MRIVILKDKKIRTSDLDEVERQYIDLIDKAAGIEPFILEEERDFSYYPTFEDNDGDLRPTNQWLKETVTPIYNKYKEDIDHVVIFVAEENWRSSGPFYVNYLMDKGWTEKAARAEKGIWGTNYSNVFYGYQVHYCRFSNVPNSLGTLHHEIHHSFDVLVKTYTGIDIEPLVGVEHWDRSVTHGGETPWKYIRYTENTASITEIATYLKQAYAKRRTLYFNTVKKPLMEQIITLAGQAIVLLRQQISRKNGIPK